MPGGGRGVELKNCSVVAGSTRSQATKGADEKGMQEVEQSLTLRK
ncbi:MAG: hypothetical protein QXK94_03545 [Candidatus Jordarchaeales archaeon]